jgi:hypothetical protein
MLVASPEIEHVVFSFTFQIGRLAHHHVIAFAVGQRAGHITSYGPVNQLEGLLNNSLELKNVPLDGAALTVWLLSWTITSNSSRLASRSGTPPSIWITGNRNT